MESNDPFGLLRFLHAQESSYEQALAEVRAGQKRSHWMWYVFPQFEGLGSSSVSRRYSIKSLSEANAYLDHPVLGPRLAEISDAAATLPRGSAKEVFGYPDNLKLRSSATLFAHVSQADSVFHRLLDRYFDGTQDSRTLALIVDSQRV